MACACEKALMCVATPPDLAILLLPSCFVLKQTQQMITIDVTIDKRRTIKRAQPSIGTCGLLERTIRVTDCLWLMKLPSGARLRLVVSSRPKNKRTQVKAFQCQLNQIGFKAVLSHLTSTWINNVRVVGVMIAEVNFGYLRSNDNRSGQ